MRAAKTDRNQQEVMDALRKVGASVHSLHRVGQGCPDLLVGFRGVNYLLEVKDKKGTLTPQQREFIISWKGGIIYVVRTAQDALVDIGAVK